MGFEAYTTDDLGAAFRPATLADWEPWVAASRTRNACLENTLADWLELYGDQRGFKRDPEPDPRCDFQAFLFRQGQRFEAAILDHLGSRARVYRVPDGARQARSLDAGKATYEAMVRGEAIISQGVLWNPENRTYGVADLLIRSDVLLQLFPDAIGSNEAAVPAPGLGAGNWHYRVADIKFSKIEINKEGHASNGHLPFMVQTFLYNEALGRIQGYLPPCSYLLGRGSTKGKDVSTNAMRRLVPVPHDCTIGQVPLRKAAQEAVDWVRRLRSEGSNWDPRSAPRLPELLPNLGESSFPWSAAVSLLAQETEDPTLAWWVGAPGRARAFLAGVERWTDPRFNARVAGVAGERGQRLDMILEVNRAAAGPAVSPVRIENRRKEWGTARGVEFYVDFETVSNLNDDFARIPEQNGQPLIFMIGCGHIEQGQWKFSCFVAEQLNPDAEATIIEQWLAHMEEVRQRLAPATALPLVFHWSAAETASFSGLKSARQRSATRAQEWKEPNWFDFLTVMRAEPVVVRGPMGFGLKTVVKSLKAHGLIETEWNDSVTDGLGAMAGAWWCSAEAQARSCSLKEIDLMSEITAYNEVDCRAMQEVIHYLRSNH
jgi:hypothetical protein